MRWLCVMLLVTTACKSKSAPKPSEPPAPAKPPSAPLKSGDPWMTPYENKGDEPIEKLSTADGDGARAATVAEKYMHAIAVGDWTTACEQRLPAERAAMAKVAGNCEDAYRAIMAGKPIQLNATLFAYAARRRGKLIAIDMVQQGQGGHDLDGTLLLGQDDGRWYLIDLDDDQVF